MAGTSGRSRFRSGPFPFHDSHNPSSIEARSGPPNQRVGWAKADEIIVMAITKKTIPPLDKPKRSAPVLHHQPAALPKGAVKTEPRKLGATGALGPLTACRGGRAERSKKQPLPALLHRQSAPFVSSNQPPDANEDECKATSCA